VQLRDVDSKETNVFGKGVSVYQSLICDSHRVLDKCTNIFYSVGVANEKKIILLHV
jgi:hypothetical protein